jgi:hypothetical protein
LRAIPIRRMPNPLPRSLPSPSSPNPPIIFDTKSST